MKQHPLWTWDFQSVSGLRRADIDRMMRERPRKEKAHADA